jgi:hypothetical protein
MSKRLAFPTLGAKPKRKLFSVGALSPLIFTSAQTKRRCLYLRRCNTIYQDLLEQRLLNQENNPGALS